MVESLYKQRNVGMATPQRIIVEVGAGRQPFPSSGYNRREIRRNELYLGIDRYVGLRRNTRETADHLKASMVVSNGGRAEIVVGDARALPLANKSADEVILCNVISDRDRIGTPEELLSDATRVLKDSGILTIIEAYTPSVIPLADLQKLVSQIGELKQTNLGREKNYNGVERYTNPSRELRISPATAEDYIATFSRIR